VLEELAIFATRLPVDLFGFVLLQLYAFPTIPTFIQTAPASKYYFIGTILSVFVTNIIATMHTIPKTASPITYWLRIGMPIIRKTCKGKQR